MIKVFLTDMNGAAVKILSAVLQDLNPFDDKSEGGVCVIDIADASRIDPAVIQRARERGCEVVAFSGSITPAISDALKKNGVARFLDFATASRFPVIPAAERDVQGKILLIDNDPMFDAIIASIGGLFGYTVERVTDAHQAVTRLKDDYSFVVHNLSLESIDLMEFIRRTPDTRLSATPYLAFLHDGNSVSLREINCGIGRLTKTIMSRNEILSVLSYNLSMSDFHSRMDGVLRGITSASSDIFAANKIRTIFFANKDHFFNGRAAADSLSLLDGAAGIGGVQESLAKLASLRWLISDHEE